MSSGEEFSLIIKCVFIDDLNFLRNPFDKIFDLADGYDRLRKENKFDKQHTLKMGEEECQDVSSTHICDLTALLCNHIGIAK
jgi:hypothetical protein